MSLIVIPSAKLCVEDPISVSRKFSQKFHDFFQTVILKGDVLGRVNHYFYKKEYQARGAPHYHMIPWIDGDPTVGDDECEVVLRWIQERITLHTRGNQQPRAASAGR